MALTISDAGNGTSITNNTACATGATVTASVGDWLVVIVAAANAGASGVSTITAPSDAAGNTYTQRAIINFTPGAVASDGATLGFYTAAITSALSSAVITANFSANTPHKSVQVYRAQPGAGEAVQFVAADGTGSTGTTSTYSAPTVSVTNGNTIFGAAAIETDDIITGDSDTTNGSWSSILTRLADAGNDSDSMTCSSQYKTVNATGNQSWACTGSTRDSARTYLVIGLAVTPAVFAGTAATAFSQTGALKGGAAGAGTATLVFAQTGAFAARAVFSSTASIVFSQTGNLAGTSSLTGTSAATFAQTGALGAQAAYFGTTTITFSQTGDFAAVAAPQQIIIRHGAFDPRDEHERRLKEDREDLQRIIDQAWRIANGEIDPVTLEVIPEPAPPDYTMVENALIGQAMAEQAQQVETFIARQEQLAEDDAIAVLLLS